MGLRRPFHLRDCSGAPFYWLLGTHIDYQASASAANRRSGNARDFSRGAHCKICGTQNVPDEAEKIAATSGGLVAGCAWVTITQLGTA